MQNPAARRYSLPHFQFCVVFTLSYYLIFNAINLHSITQWFTQKSGTDVVSAATFYVTGYLLFLFAFLLLAQRYFTKLIAIVLLVLGTGGAYFIGKYHVAIDNSMLLNVLHTDRSEVHSLLSWQMAPYILLLLVAPLALVLPLHITYPRRYFLQSLKWMGATLAVSVALVYGRFEGISRAANLSNKLIVHTLLPINFLQGFGSIAQQAIEPLFSRRHTAIDIPGNVTTQRNLVVVLAVGETSRRDNFSVYGYTRQNTTPHLAATAGLHLLNGRARRGSTLYALPEILTKNDIALTAFTHQLGIDTVCYVNYTLYDNCSVPGEVPVSHCAHDGQCFDEDVIPLLDAKLRSYISGYSLIVLHLGGGSHGPNYQERYPAEFRRFTPLCTDADVVNQCTKEQLFNSFDNTILYTDYVVSTLIQRLDQSSLPYVFLYLSDHGESLLENGRIFHGTPPGVPLPPEQARIPLIVKSSVPIAIALRDEYEQRDVFDTILGLLSVQSPLHEPARSFINLKAE